MNICFSLFLVFYLFHFQSPSFFFTLNSSLEDIHNTSAILNISRSSQVKNIISLTLYFDLLFSISHSLSFSLSITPNSTLEDNHNTSAILNISGSSQVNILSLSFSLSGIPSLILSFSLFFSRPTLLSRIIIIPVLSLTSLVHPR